MAIQYAHDFIIYHDGHKNIVTIKITDNMNNNEPARLDKHTHIDHKCLYALFT